ncbi:MAG: hypothetical protein PWQ20_1094 [Thermotogaceae bacterium]|jgi:hypothetical protein|nr:hypothetical protein [Thermotogaceae bacterium]
MRKGYLFFVILPVLILILASCGRVPIPEDQISDDFIKYMATAYNSGIGYSFEDLKTIADDDSYTYDDDVLKYFKYFSGEITLDSLNITRLNFLRATDTSDSRVRDYIVSSLENFLNSTSSSTFIDQYDEKVPVNSSVLSDFDRLNPNIITSYEKRESLVNRIYELLKKDYDSYGLFRINFEDFYPNKELSESELRLFSGFVVDIAYTYANSNLTLQRLKSTSSPDIYHDIIELSHIPVELLLAVAYQESRFFPGSYRAEIEDGNIYSLSFGMSHILIDSDNIDISSNYSDIGNGEKESCTFELISYYYLGNSLNEEDIFTDLDLLMIRGAFLYSAIYLDMIYQKLSSYF